MKLGNYRKLCKFPRPDLLVITYLLMCFALMVYGTYLHGFDILHKINVGCDSVPLEGGSEISTCVDVEYDAFGYDLAVSGERILVGAPNLSGRGSAYLYDCSNEICQQTDRLAVGLVSKSSGFGLAVGLSGDLALIGAPWQNNRNGAVYLFDCSDENCSLINGFTPENAGDSSSFGLGIEFDNNRALISVYNNPLLDQQSRAYLYDCSLEGCVLKNRIFPDAGNIIELGMSGDLIVLGAFLRNFDDEESSGAAWIYNCPNFDCQEIASLTSLNEKEHDGFGVAVDVSGSKVMIGASGEDSFHENGGAVYLYECENELCSDPYIFTPQDNEEEDIFGFGIELEGTRAVIHSRDTIYFFSCLQSCMEISRINREEYPRGQLWGGGEIIGNYVAIGRLSSSLPVSSDGHVYFYSMP